MSEMNPYQPPAPMTPVEVDFDASGRRVDAGHGWSWITAAFALFKQQPLLWVLLFIVYFVCNMLLGMVPLLGGIATMLLLPVFGAGFMQACRSAEDGGEISVAQLFSGFKSHTNDLMLLGLFACLPLAIVLAGLLLAGGAGIFGALIGGSTQALLALGVMFLLVLLLALVVSVPVYMALWFAAPLVVFDGLKPGAALKASFSVSLKNWAAFTLYGLVLIALFVAAAIPFLLGLLVMAPVAMISVYTAYRDIFRSQSPDGIRLS